MEEFGVGEEVKISRLGLNFLSGGSVTKQH